MKEYFQIYKIADVIFRVISPFSFAYEREQHSEFLSNETSENFTLFFEHITDITQYIHDDLKLVHTSDWVDIFLDSKNIEYSFFKHENLYIAVTCYAPGENCATTYYLDEVLMKKRMLNGCSPLSYIRIEKGLVQNQALLLHSCHIQYKGCSIMFSAPSGTGKSTQGELWRKYMNADVINGDRTVLKKQKDQWMAYGVPMSGTSGICQNKEGKASAIIVIRQAKKDSIRRATAMEAFRFIYSEIILSTWDKLFVEQAIELISDLVEHVPIYYFECTKEKSAVETLLNQLKVDEILE